MSDTEAIAQKDTTASATGIYNRPDTDAGFITDASEIMQLKAIRKSDIINSGLLGEFDENGSYFIDKNIIIQLVRLPKRITKQNEYGTFATAKVEDKEFHFRMAPTRVFEGRLVSELELLEEIYHANGYIIDTRTTLLATYTLDSVSNFEEIARNMFHISTHPEDDDFGGDPGEGNGVLIPDEADYIKHRLAYLEAMGMVSLGLYERLEEAYYNKRIKILSNMPEAAVVLAEYKKQLSKVEHFFVQNSKRKYRAMNDILTAVIEGAKGDALRRNNAYREQMKEANHVYLKTILQIDETVRHSMEVINAVAESMPVGENKEIKVSSLVVATKPDDQNKKEKGAATPKKPGGGGPKVPKFKGTPYKPDKYKLNLGEKPKGKDNKKSIELSHSFEEQEQQTVAEKQTQATAAQNPAPAKAPKLSTIKIVQEASVNASPEQSPTIEVTTEAGVNLQNQAQNKQSPTIGVINEAGVNLQKKGQKTAQDISPESASEDNAEAVLGK